MKIKLRIEKQIDIEESVLEEKINNYLTKNYYRVLDRGSGFIIFGDDEFSERKLLQSDIHNGLERVNLSTEELIK